MNSQELEERINKIEATLKILAKNLPSSLQEELKVELDDISERAWERRMRE